MEQPRRIQRKRSKGFKMPPNTVYVGRPSKWGNPFKVGGNIHTAAFCLESFEYWIKKVLLKDPNYLQELKGKNLACWCKIGEPCHADILLKLANKNALHRN